ncbi:hypothetical protein BY996DRAFT_6451147 [Phakopsora pachyrhizi]|nr:hypothetical protein BY996DRAFT_6451147 [Phakopsora pachyrhizi]
MLREFGPASFDEEAKVEMKLMVKGLKSDERIKPVKEQQEQQLKWNNLDKKGECYKVVGIMDGCRDLANFASKSRYSHRKVLCTAGKIVSLEANDI